MDKLAHRPISMFHRRCTRCDRWKTNKGAKFRPFVCAGCLKEKTK